MMAFIQGQALMSEFFGLTAYLGTLTFLVGAVLFAVIGFKKVGGNRRVLKFVGVSVARLAVSFVLSVSVWLHWPFGFDVMLGPVLLPAVFSELVTIIGAYSLLRLKQNNR